MRILVDEDLPPKLAKALDLLDDEVEVLHMRDAIGAGTPDERWLAACGASRDVVVTHDGGVWKKKSNREQLLRHGVGVFIVRGKGFWRLVATIVRAWPSLVRTARDHVRPFAIELREGGTQVAYRSRR